jgi:molecular chaperone GrpE
LSDERKSAEVQPVEQEPSPARTVEAEEELVNEDLDQLIRDAQAAILHNRHETQDEEAEAEVEQTPSLEPAVDVLQEVDEAFDHKLEELERQIAQRDDEIGQLKDRMLRLAAEFDNFKKRSRKERSDLVLYANEELVKQLLPVLDNFERALESGRQQNMAEGFFKGIELIYGQALNILERIGLKHIEVVGQTFDPNLHEAVMRDPNAELPDNTIVQEFRRGYSLNEKVIRQAMVSVAARPGGDASETDVEPNQSAKDSEEQPAEEAPADSAPAQSEPAAPGGEA